MIHDNQTFGKGVANAFRLKAASIGIKVLGFKPWDPKATSYEAIGQHDRGHACRTRSTSAASSATTA